MAIRVLIVGVSLLLFAPWLYAVTWEAQAERLQQVSAAQLDAAPIASPYALPTTVRFQINAAMLPDVNPTVGAKTEKVPSSPIHAITMLQFEKGGDFTPTKWISASLWAGHLPAGGEKAVGVSAKLHQTIFGGGFMFTHKGQFFKPYLQFFGQQGTAAMEGAITAENAEDQFDLETKIWGLAIGNQFQAGAQTIWFAASYANRSADSTFYIEEDQTTFKIVDYQKLSFGDGLRQLVAGVDFSWGLRIGAGVSNVPNRITMPKAVIAYSWSF